MLRAYVIIDTNVTVNSCLDVAETVPAVLIVLSACATITLREAT